MATKTTPAPTKRMKRLDLDAGTREASYPDGILIVLGGNEYTFPAELPIDVFDPFLSEELDVVDLIRSLYAILSTERGETTTDALLTLLQQRPGLHKQIIAAVREALALLLGADQYAAWVASRPTVTGLMRLAGALMDEYGVALGELFASPNSSTTGGATQKETSGQSTDSTSDTPESPTTTND